MTTWTPARASSSAASMPRASARDDHRALAGLEPEVADQAQRAVGEHDADEVVAGEHERLLDRAGRDHDPLRAHAQQQVPGLDRHEPALVDAERATGRDELERLVAEPADVLVDEQHLLTGGRGGPRRREPGAPAADDEHVDAAVLGVVAPRPPAVLVDAAEAGEVAKHLLVHGPQATRPDQRPVVEADRRERLADLVDDRDEVAFERADHVLRLDHRPGARRLRADADVGRAVDLHHAIGTAARDAQQPARAVVLEAAREDALPRREERRPDRVALVRSYGLAAEAEDDLARAVDPLGRLRRQAHQAASSGARPAGQLDALDLVRARVALGEEPDLAAVAVMPPLALHAGDVAAEVDVVGELGERRGGLRARRHLARVRELVDVTRAAVRTLSRKDIIP